MRTLFRTDLPGVSTTSTGTTALALPSGRFFLVAKRAALKGLVLAGRTRVRGGQPRVRGVRPKGVATASSFRKRNKILNGKANNKVYVDCAAL